MIIADQQKLIAAAHAVLDHPRNFGVTMEFDGKLEVLASCLPEQTWLSRLCAALPEGWDLIQSSGSSDMGPAAHVFTSPAGYRCRAVESDDFVRTAQSLVFLDTGKES